LNSLEGGDRLPWTKRTTFFLVTLSLDDDDDDEANFIPPERLNQIRRVIRRLKERLSKSRFGEFGTDSPLRR